MKRYSEYKDSKMKWAPRIPIDWQTRPVKGIFDVQLGKMFQNDAGSPDDLHVPYLKALHVNWGIVSIEDLPEMWASPSELKQYGVQNGDLLVCEGGEVGRSGIVYNPPQHCIIQNALHRVRGWHDSDIRFLMYVLHAVASADWFSILCNKATIAHFTREKLTALQIPVPSNDEQVEIADYLDRKTAQIDALIAKKERMIELLKEERAAVINQAVTRGLDPNVEMKDSGIEWAPRIPKKWHARPVKAFFDVQLGKMLQPESGALGDRLTPYLKALHVNWGNVATSDLPEMWANSSDLNQYGIQAGDLLVCEGGEVGRAGIVVEVPQGCIIQNALHRVRARENFDVRFLTYVLYSVAEAGWFSILCNKATIAHLTCEKLVALQIPATIGEEQREIADYLDKKTVQIDGQVSREERSIELLKEYRTALISEAVTGKIDLREV